MLVLLGGHRDLVKSHGFSNDGIAEAVGLGRWVDCESDDFSQKTVLQTLRKLHAEAEYEDGEAEVAPALTANIRNLSELVGLSNVDCRILEFAVAIHCERLLDDTADWLGMLTSAKLIYPLSVVLDVPETAVRTALSGQSILARSGLVSVDYAGVSYLKGKLNLLSDQFAEYISMADTDPVELLRDAVFPSGPALLALSDYPHIQPSLSVLRPYMQKAVETRKKGVNIFLHGAPGTGKSELSRALAANLGVELFEIASEDTEGAPLQSGQRLRAYKAAQCIFAQRQAILVFDEVEDVFHDGDAPFGRRGAAHARKAWINRMLEQNAVPTLWISNSVNCVDPAFIRRFDMVIEVPVPPKQQRERILNEACADVLDAVAVKRLAQCETLAPAVATRACAVVRSVLDEVGAEAGSAAAELLINNTISAQGHRPIVKNDPDRLPETYDPAFIQADANLQDVAEGLCRARAGRLCLYGPPGTGKSAYARWVADKLGAPLCVRRASDLLSKWIGDNEKNIAHAFSSAQQAGAVLLIDEVDGFLRDRRGSDRGWEASLVNEMLTQMEAFAGIFIASTNLMDNLDQAALRRFDLKVQFGFLTAAQAQRLLTRHCEALGLALPDASLGQKLAVLTNLTPGDFAAVARQHRFHPLSSADDFIEALRSESTLKDARKPMPIGFF
ncbi:MAG TPA: ATP-binding protein [Noviherbaspirillum sp.]|nr:ATP-binding protein [Noviherbaspirillum sp.]